MSYLRTVSTRRLLALIAATVLAGAASAAIAVAATSGGPVPRRESLARAVRTAITARAPVGITARVSFTDNLIPSSDLQTSDPLLEGGTGRLWLSKDALRIELAGSNGDVELLVEDDRFWVYDPTMNTVLRGTLPSPPVLATAHQKPRRTYTYREPTLSEIQGILDRLATHLDGLRAIPTDVAGRAAYRVRISPKPTAQNGSLLGAVSLAWDAVRGVPLSFSLYAKGDATPVLALTATHISYGRVSSGVFAISPPAGTTTTTLDAARTSSSKRLEKKSGVKVLGYGHGLSRVTVIEQPATGHGTTSPSAAPPSAATNLSLPTRTVDGSIAQLLETELGTVVTWTHRGTRYTVAGFVPASRALAVARGL